MKVYQRIAELIELIENYHKENFTSSSLACIAQCAEIESEYLPHGSGLNGIVAVDLEKSNQSKIVINCDFHHMDSDGFYREWSTHEITIKPTFRGFEMRVGGRNVNDIKEYLYGLFYDALMVDMPGVQV